MNTAMLIAALLASGACAESRFIGTDGSALAVIVCPMQLPAPVPDVDGDEEAPMPAEPGEGI